MDVNVDNNGFRGEDFVEFVVLIIWRYYWGIGWFIFDFFE